RLGQTIRWGRVGRPSDYQQRRRTLTAPDLRLHSLGLWREVWACPNTGFSGVCEASPPVPPTLLVIARSGEPAPGPDRRPPGAGGGLRAGRGSRSETST